MVFLKKNQRTIRHRRCHGCNEEFYSVINNVRESRYLVVAMVHIYYEMMLKIFAHIIAKLPVKE